MNGATQEQTRYHGFLVLPESCVDGWCLGLISELAPRGATPSGDAFVVAPDGTQAALVWETGAGSVEEILPPDAERWGVYAVYFSQTVRGVADLVQGFRTVLPALRAIHAHIHGAQRL
jgi:hypothetical protein